MAFTITTLTDASGTPVGATELSKDNKSAHWSTALHGVGGAEALFTIKQQLSGRNARGIPLRRSLVQAVYGEPYPLTGVESVSPMELVIVNMTITSPSSISVMSAAERQGPAAWIRNFVTNGNLDKLFNGEL